MLTSSTTDGDGNTSTYSYDADGNPVSDTAPGANGTAATTTTAYTSALQDTDCSGTAEAAATATCSQDPGPSPVTPAGTIAAPSGAPPLGLTWTLNDTSGNQLYSTTGVYGPTGTYEYSRTTYQLFKGNSVTLNSTNISCTYTPPSASLPCATIGADGVVTQLEYNSAGDLELSATPDGNSGGQLATTTYTYNGDGEELTSVSPDGNVSGANVGNYTTTTAWNADSQKTSVSQGSGSGYTDTPRATSYGYDGDGNQTTTKDARGYTTTTTYNADDEATLRSDPLSNVILTCYDGDGNVAQTVPAVGVAANLLTAASCPTSYPAGYSDRLATDATTYTFNAAGDKTAMSSPAPAGQTGSETTTYGYDADGRLLSTTSPPVSNGGADVVTVDTYTAIGDIATETTGYGTSAAATISYCYDPDGDQTAVVMQDGNTSGTAACSTAYPWTVTASPQVSYQTTYAYDSVGDLASTTTPATAAAPSGATTTATYDAAGNELTSKDPDGVTTTSTYTPLGLVATVSYSGSSAHSVTDSYDADGNQTGQTDATGTSSYVYDSFDELTSYINGAGKTVTYGYDADGDVIGITYPLSSPSWASTSTVAYGYNNDDVLTSATDFNGHAITITPNPDGLATGETLGATGDTISTAYDPTDSPSSITLKNSGGTTLQSFSYSDSPNATVLSETDTPSSPQSPAVYAYDGRARVTSMTPGTGAEKTYGFDASSNLTTLPTGATGTYNDAGELTSSAKSGTTTNYTYSADGERLNSTQGSLTVTSGSWNGAEQLTAYSDSAADMTAATYDGNGLRATATTGGATQSFTWDTETQVPSLLMDSTYAYIYASGTAPAEQVNLSTGVATYLLADSLGSVRGIVNSAGTLTATTAYDAWGDPESSGGLTATTQFGYAGAYTDPDGLIYLIARYYDPATGQFTTVDPDITQTNAPYQYANGNPVTAIDPTGARCKGCRAPDWQWVYSNWATWGGTTVSLWGISIHIPSGGMQIGVYSGNDQANKNYIDVYTLSANFYSLDNITNPYVTWQFRWPGTGEVVWTVHSGISWQHTNGITFNTCAYSGCAAVLAFPKGTAVVGILHAENTDKAKWYDINPHNQASLALDPLSSGPTPIED